MAKTYLHGDSSDSRKLDWIVETLEEMQDQRREEMSQAVHQFAHKIADAAVAVMADPRYAEDHRIVIPLLCEEHVDPDIKAIVQARMPDGVTVNIHRSLRECPELVIDRPVEAVATMPECTPTNPES